MQVAIETFFEMELCFKRVCYAKFKHKYETVRLFILFLWGVHTQAT